MLKGQTSPRSVPHRTHTIVLIQRAASVDTLVQLAAHNGSNNKKRETFLNTSEPTEIRRGS